MQTPKKVLIIGSGPIVIAQAAEFDYSGTQACKALREEGVVTVLVNSNPATIMTDPGIADFVYIEPLTAEVLEKIIQLERPDGLLPTLGGQTALNLAVELAEAGVLDKYGVRVLGTPIKTIKEAEDRELFKRMLIEINEPVPPSKTVSSVREAIQAASEIGFPVVVRPAYTLGGSGGGMARDLEGLERIVKIGLGTSPINQVLIEKSIEGWKEIEYEVMRDGADNCIIVCNMENIDPMGVHTGDSIVVAPSQTLSDKEYQMLRSASLKIIRRLKIEGGCNIQFALPPHPIVAQKWSPEPHKSPYYVIEVNPRVSRSSALASKATGYPIARVAAKIALGKRLDEIPNRITGKTMASFEPSLDYCVVKIPRFPFEKFPLSDRTIGTQMKSTGEAMAIERCFEGALNKAVRSLEFGNRSLLWEDKSWGSGLDDFPLYPPNDLRLWAIMAALRRGYSPEEISRKTAIDPWFIYKMENIVRMERKLLLKPLTPQLLHEAKRLGFSDEVIATLSDLLPERVRELRRLWGIKPVYKMVDTCAAEFEASTPYFYSTYEGENEAPPLEGEKALVIGAGPIRIGQGIEFDYCSVHSVWALKSCGWKAIIVNCNPETVSTDFDTSDRLYFEPLDEESVRDILENEGYTPSIVQFGGQTAINLSQALGRAGCPILGSTAQTIDISEERGKFEELLSKLDIPQPPGAAVRDFKEALKITEILGYPVLVRPSYVLGGRAMEIVYSQEELRRYIEEARELSDKHPILVDKYLEGREVEVDAVCDGEETLIPGIMEHIERAGVHSGDSIAIYPPQNLSQDEINLIIDYTCRIASALKIKGLMNIQFVIMPPENGQPQVYVLEVNQRASRTVPFISKVTGVPLVKLAVQIMLGARLRDLGYLNGLLPSPPWVGIKAPVFSMSKLSGADHYLGPEMKSTGEVMGIDKSYEGALVKALIASGMMLPKQGRILLSIADKYKQESLPLIKKFFNSGFKLYATKGTAEMLRKAGLPVIMVARKIGEGSPDVVEVIGKGMVDGVINVPTHGKMPLRDGFQMRRAAMESRLPCFTSLDTANAVAEALNSTPSYLIQSLNEYSR